VSAFASRNRRDLAAWALLALILLGVGFVRFRLAELPLERDEGEYAYMGHLLLEGVPPYREAGNHKFPGVYFAYAAMMAVFGESAAGIRLGLLAVNASSTLLLFLLGRRLLGDVGAVASAAAFALMSLSPSVLGLAGHLTQFLVPPLLAGCLLLWRAVDSGRVWALAAAGACLGLAVLVRQTSLVFVAFGAAFWLFAVRHRLGRSAQVRAGLGFAASAAAPLLLTLVYLKLAGAFGHFWWWTVTQTIAYGSEVSFSDGLQMFAMETSGAIGVHLGLWIGAAAGLLLALRDRSERSVFLLGLLAAGLISVVPGYYFRPHYYVQCLPALALLLGHAVEEAGRRLRAPWLRIGFGTLVLLAFAYPVVAQAELFFRLTPAEAARRIYGINPFPEAVEIGRYIREHSSPQDTLAVLGSEPQILFYAGRRSATSYLYGYPLVASHRLARPMQLDAIRQIEAAAPEFIVLVNVSLSWLTQPGSDDTIFRWAESYLGKHYRQEGIVEAGSEYRFLWGPDAQAYRLLPDSMVSLMLYRRADQPSLR
jgi:hypothetical protein